MQIIVDSIIYSTQNYGGISRIFNEVLPRLCNLDPKLLIHLLITPNLLQSLPHHDQISPIIRIDTNHFLNPLPIVNRYIPYINLIVNRARMGGTRDKIWHSTYYTLPNRWAGPVVITAYDMIHELFPHLYGNRETYTMKNKREAIRAADAIICISKTTREDVINFYNIDPAKTWVIYLGFSNVFRQLDVEGDSQSLVKPFLLYVGSRSSYKGFRCLLEAYSVWSSINDVNMVVVGTSWNEEEKALLKERSLQEKVVLKENVGDEELCHLYNRAAAFVYPSLYEGFGIPLLEAMACGCPVVASRIPSTVEVAGEIPIYFEPGSADDLKACLDQVSNEEIKSLMRQKGLDWVERYSWDRTAGETLQLYKSL